MKRSDASGPLVWALGALVALVALVTRRPRPPLPPGVDPEDLAAGYELSDMRPRVVFAGAVALLLALATLLVLVTVFESVVTGVPPRLGGLEAQPRPTPPPPALEAEPGQSLQPYLAAEQARLNSYRWVNRSAGVAAVPIDRAMDLIAQRGLPARPATSALDSGTSSPSYASSGRVEERYP